MSCCISFTIHYISKIISPGPGMSRDLNDGVSWFLAPLRPYVFSAEGGSNKFCLERSALSISLQKMCLVSRFDGYRRSKISRYKTLSKSREASFTEAKLRLKLYSLQRVTSEFCEE